jgi:hypothetical protein
VFHLHLETAGQLGFFFRCSLFAKILVLSAKPVFPDGSEEVHKRSVLQHGDRMRNVWRDHKDFASTYLNAPVIENEFQHARSGPRILFVNMRVASHRPSALGGKLRQGPFFSKKGSDPDFMTFLVL